MLFAVFIIILTLFIAYLVLRKTALPFSQTARIKRRLQHEGVEADAVLLNIEQTAVYNLQVQVHPSTGRNFVSEAVEVLSPIDRSRLRTGSALKVKYNRANTKEVMVLHTGTGASFTLHKNTTP